MKQTKRFMAMLLATSATALSTVAADWKVNIDPVALNPGDTVCIQNVATGRYLTGGEAWGTQAIVGVMSSASRCILVVGDDGTYQIKNNVKDWGTDNPNIVYRQPQEGLLGTGVKGCFVDYSGAWSAASSKWTIAEVGNKTYTFQVPNLEEYQITELSTEKDSLLGYVEGEFLGVNRTHESKAKSGDITWGLYYDVNYADSAANCQFQFFPAAIVEAKAKLLQAVEIANESGVDVSAAAALLASTTCTAEQALAEVDNLSEAIEETATPENPRDVTSKYLPNSTPIAKGTPEGWTVTQPDGTAGSTGDSSSGVGEFWAKLGYSIKYTIKNFPAGVYQFKAIALTRDGMKTKFFVGNDTIDVATVASSVVNDRAAAANWFNTDDDGDGVTNGTNVISVVLPQDTDITLGITAASTGDGWTVWREFQIISQGRGVETFRYINQDILDQISTIKDENENYTTSLMEEAESTASAGVSATTKEEAASCYVKALALLNDLKANVAAWENLRVYTPTVENEAYQLNNGDAVLELVDQANQMLDELTASTDEVLAMIENMEKTLDECRKGSYGVGDEVTYLIKNPTFNDETDKPENLYEQKQSTTGWIGANVIGAGWITDTRLAEVYNQDCNIHQDLTGLQKGAYRLSIQAFYRNGSASASKYQAYLEGDSLSKAYIYMGLTQQRVKSIYACTFPESVTSLSRNNYWVNVGTADEPLYVPNTMDESYVAFNGSVDGDQDPAFDNNYRNVVYGVVTEDGGSMPIGFKIEDHTEASWVIFRDFRLEYMGNDPVYVKPVLENKIKEAQDEYLSQKMTAEHKDALNKTVADGQSAISAMDGDAMMDAFTAIANAEDAADISIAAYQKLEASYDSLKAEYDDATQALEDARTQASNLLTEVSAMLENGTIDVDDIPAKQKEMLLARKALMIQPGSDENPSKYTNWIVNPTYEKQDGWVVNKTAGDGTPGVSNNTMEIWNATADVYQDIEGLPEGTYEVRVQSLFRPVSSAEAWADLLGDSIENYGERATIYANWDSITPSYWCSKYDFDTYSWTIGDYVSMTDSVYNETTGELEPVTYHLANSREAAEYQFQMNYYPVQKFYTYVGANGLLRLGFKNTAHKVQDWFVVSNWELYYLGKDSKNAEATGIRDIESNDNVNFNEVYTIDGRRVNGLQKGLNIVRGKTADGKVVTKKIVVK